MWSDGISEGSFRKIEILNEFKEKNVEIPESFFKEFNDSIIRHIKKRMNEE